MFWFAQDSPGLQLLSYVIINSTPFDIQKGSGFTSKLHGHLTFLGEGSGEVEMNKCL